MFRRHITFVLLVLMPPALSACTSWRASAERPGAVIPSEAPERVRVTTQDGAVATIPAPLVRNDSIVSGRPYQPGVALSEVALFEVREFSLSRTVGLAAAGAVVASVWTVALAGSGADVQLPDPDPKLTPDLLKGWGWIGRLLTGR